MQNAPQDTHECLVTVQDEELEYSHRVFVLDLVNIQRDKKRRKGRPNRKVLLVQVVAYVRKILLEFLVKVLNYVHKLGHVVHVDAPPLISIHDKYQAPKDLLLILNVHQEHGHDVVEALNIADLGIIVGIGKQDVQELVLCLLSVPGRLYFILILIVLGRTACLADCQRREGPRHILLDSGFFIWILKLRQLIIEVIRVLGLLLLYLTQQAPYLAPERVRYSLNNTLLDPLSRDNGQRIEVINSVVHAHQLPPLPLRDTRLHLALQSNTILPLALRNQVLEFLLLNLIGTCHVTAN